MLKGIPWFCEKVTNPVPLGEALTGLQGRIRVQSDQLDQPYDTLNRSTSCPFHTRNVGSAKLMGGVSGRVGVRLTEGRAGGMQLAALHCAGPSADSCCLLYRSKTQACEEGRDGL